MTDPDVQDKYVSHYDVARHALRSAADHYFGAESVPPVETVLEDATRIYDWLLRHGFNNDIDEQSQRLADILARLDKGEKEPKEA
jgi:hypothetical protein